MTALRRLDPVADVPGVEEQVMRLADSQLDPADPGIIREAPHFEAVRRCPAGHRGHRFPQHQPQFLIGELARRQEAKLREKLKHRAHVLKMAQKLGLPNLANCVEASLGDYPPAAPSPPGFVISAGSSAFRSSSSGRTFCST